MIRGLIALTLLSLPLPARASLEISTYYYTCERGVGVPATYINETSNDPDAGSAVILMVENRQITLWSVPSASGARYGWPSDGSHYIWWTKGEEATLYWHEAGVGEDQPLLTHCALGAQTE
ncbi:MliC family protein [Pseudorhodobacter sp.]|uniref:MliC family protein n=1 Tax=Pseudorhodobacter sp. TaxID=1934400 RepID=UPI002648722F|nr:MliC family protein [Pseudorhodobacter sp.]MDN5788311.1 MliC family protein [Pseudorhodobacter sp.]